MPTRSKKRNIFGLVRPANSSIFKKINPKPAAAFWGDSDGDKIYNAFDCQPRNRFRQDRTYSEEEKEFKKRFLAEKTQEAFDRVQQEVHQVMPGDNEDILKREERIEHIQELKRGPMTWEKHKELKERLSLRRKR